jgi:hypothetical protein
MSDPITTILEDVAAGRVDPATAARLLDEARGPAGSVSGGEASPPAVPEVARVSIRAVSRSVRLIGDAAVTTVAVDGPHVVRREGDTLVVTGEGDRFPTDQAFSMITSGRWRDWFSQHQTMTVRIRPDLAVGVEVTAGSLTSDGARALDHVRVTAGSARITGVTVPVDVLVQAGSVTLGMVATEGRSRVRCESGSLKVHLGAGSNVRVRTDVQLGKVVVDGPGLPRGGDKEAREVTIGDGRAELDVSAVMGSAHVQVGG